MTIYLLFSATASTMLDLVLKASGEVCLVGFFKWPAALLSPTTPTVSLVRSVGHIVPSNSRELLDRLSHLTRHHLTISLANSQAEKWVVSFWSCLNPKSRAGRPEPTVRTCQFHDEKRCSVFPGSPRQAWSQASPQLLCTPGDGWGLTHLIELRLELLNALALKKKKKSCLLQQKINQYNLFYHLLPHGSRYDQDCYLYLPFMQEAPTCHRQSQHGMTGSFLTYFR